MKEMNKCVLFTKYFDDLSVEKMGEEILHMGFDGLLMTCREGTTVNIKAPKWFTETDAEKAEKAGSTLVVDWVPLKQGLVPWKRALQGLEHVDYSGPLAFCTESETNNREKQKEFLKQDVQFMRKPLAEMPPE